MSLMEFVLTIAFAAVGAYGGSYLRQRGKNLATHEDLEFLTAQVAATTKVTEEIKLSISFQDWTRREWYLLKRSKLEDVVAESIKSQSWLEASRVMCFNGESHDPDGDPIMRLSMLVRLYFSSELSESFNPYSNALHDNRLACLKMRGEVMALRRTANFEELGNTQAPVIAAYSAMMAASVRFEHDCSSMMARLFTSSSVTGPQSLG